MNIVDVIILLFLFLFTIIGYRRGVLKEAILLLGTILIYIISYSLKDVFGVFLCKTLPFFSLSGFVSLNILIYQFLAFFLIFLFLFSLFGIVIKATGILQKIVNLTFVLKFPSKILGAFLAFLEGYILLFSFLMVLSIPLKNNSYFTTSILNRKILSSSILSKNLGNIDHMVIDIYSFQDNPKSLDTVNLEILKLYLKYNIISEKDLHQIISSGKLDSIKKINSLDLKSN